MNGSGGFNRWRFAARLSRREVRRRPWRSLLVALLVAVPVMAMTVAAVYNRTRSSINWFEESYGTGVDLVVQGALGADPPDLGPYLPEGATTQRLVTGYLPVAPADGQSSWVRLSDEFGIGADAAASSGVGELLAGEVWLNDAAADALGVETGDTLALRHPRGEWTVAGISGARRGDDGPVVVMPDLPVEQFRPDVLGIQVLVDLPGRPSPAAVEAIGSSITAQLSSEESGTGVSWRGLVDTDDVGAVIITYVAGVLGLAATGIIIAAAFATSARRQLVTIGLLSSNGSSELLTRRLLALQGLWTGVLGSLIGLGAGAVVLLTGRSRLEAISGEPLPSYRWHIGFLALVAATGIVASTLAALVPARSASRVPVMAALAGRRPLGTVPARLVPRGIALAALGVLLLVMAAASGDGGTVITVGAALGGVLTLVGMCCCSPLAVDAMSRVSARSRGGWRLAGRSLGRTQTRSAAVVTAIAVVVAITTAGSAFALGVEGNDGARWFPVDAAVALPDEVFDEPVDDGQIDGRPLSEQPVSGAIVDAVNDIVPSAEWYLRREATWDPAPVEIGDVEYTAWQGLVVADEATMDLYELSDGERDLLDEIGVLALNTPVSSVPPLRIVTEDGAVSLDVALRPHVEAMLRGDDTEFTGVTGIGTYMITEAAARGAGFDIVVRGGFFRSASPLTDSQRRALEETVNRHGDADLSRFYVDVASTVPAPESFSVLFESGPSGLSPRPVQAILAGTALVLTLLVVAIALALAAAEGANERDVLVAIGGRPRTMRAMAASKAAVLALTAVVLGLPFGLLPALAVMRGAGQPLGIPWLAIGLLLAMPFVASGATWLVSAIAQRTRPLRISQLAFD